MDENQKINLLVEEYQVTGTGEPFVGFTDKVPLSYLIDQINKSCQRWGLHFVMPLGSEFSNEYALEHFAKDMRDLFYRGAVQ